MPKRLVALTDEQFQLLSQLFNTLSATPNVLQRLAEPVANQANDVYVAAVPPGGIPGMKLCQDKPGTGTNDGLADQPGTAECEIYKIHEDEEHGPEMRAYPTLSKTVYNISTKAINSAYVVVAKLKGKGWVAVPGNEDEVGTCDTGTGTGTGTGDGDTGTGTEAPGTGTGTDRANCIWEINNIHLEDLDVEADPDYVFGFKDGCMVLVEAGPCNPGTGSP